MNSGLKNGQFFSTTELLTDAKSHYQQPATTMLQEVENYRIIVLCTNLRDPIVSGKIQLYACLGIVENQTAVWSGTPWLMDSGTSKHFTMN